MISAGTELSEAYGAAAHNYGLLNGSLSSDWTKFTNVVSGIKNGTEVNHTKFFYATKYVKFLALENYSNSQSNVEIDYRNIVFKEIDGK